jgi:hypothetical protein
MPPHSFLRTQLVLPLIVVTCLVFPLMVGFAPRVGQPVAILSWSSAGGGAVAIAARAEGELRSASRDSRLVVASSTAPDFVARLYASGALLVVDATMAAACLPRFILL